MENSEKKGGGGDVCTLYANEWGRRSLETRSSSSSSSFAYISHIMTNYDATKKGRESMRESELDQTTNNKKVGKERGGGEEKAQ